MNDILMVLSMLLFTAVVCYMPCVSLSLMLRVLKRNVTLATVQFID